MQLLPSFENFDPSQLTGHDLHIITGSTTRKATLKASDYEEEWKYENRREAQAILNFLYLGPTSVIRDHAFLQREGITMMLVVRPLAMQVPELLGVKNASNALGIPVHYIPVDGLFGPDGLIHGFSNTIKLINNHLLSVYQSQASSNNGNGQICVRPDTFRHGKVLVTCDSGNDGSAAIVAAYIMSFLGMDMVNTVQLMTPKRFSCSFGEDTKRMLKSWEDILLATSMVAQDKHHRVADGMQRAENPNNTSITKRGLDDMMEMNLDDCQCDDAVSISDRDRFMERGPFVPFVEAEIGTGQM